MIQNIKGMPDILPTETPKWRFVEETIRSVMDTYAYQEIRTPILEETSLFVRSVGEHTDIVGKEMFTFTDQGEVQMSLRPEGTASVMRSYIQHHLNQQSSFSKMYYMGPMFRRERPQKGRLRQFHQLGVEAIGLTDPMVDVEVITLLMEICKKFNLPGIQLELNSLGDLETRKNYREVLKKYFQIHAPILSDGEKIRLDKNPLRLLDSKNPDLAPAIAEAPSILEHLTNDSKRHFGQVQQGLESIGIPFHINSRIVRGLDYYSHTAFEVMAAGLGSQNTVGAGGRYDQLSTEIGGTLFPAIGFALGIERLLISLENQKMDTDTKKRIEIIPLDDKAKTSAFQIGHALRSSLDNYKIDIQFKTKNLKSALSAANKNGASWAFILGENEISKNEVLIKNLQNGTQESINVGQLAAYIKDKL